MINPKYAFDITAKEDNDLRKVNPLYGDDLALEFAKESNEEFFRKSLSGKLTFVRDDYDFIASKGFECEFIFRILISYTNGRNYTLYWTGKFYKTDCEFNENDKSVSVKPEVVDEYTDVLAGLEKEYDLLDLAPQIDHITMTKRPMIQIYVPGQSVVGCFLSGMYWEEDCEAVDSEKDLTDKYYFAKILQEAVLKVSGNITPDATGLYYGNYSGGENDFTYSNGTYTIKKVVETNQGGWTKRFTIVRNSDSKELWEYKYSTSGDIKNDPDTFSMVAVAGSGVSGTPDVDLSVTSVFGRFVTDADEVKGLKTYDLLATDMVGNNRNYHKVIGYDFKDTIYFSDRLTSTPTKWGIYQPNQYYQEPYALGVPAFYPVAKSAWGRLSIWFAFSVLDEFTETAGRKQFKLKDAFPLSSVISVLLAKIAPNLTHEATESYSKFLYSGSNPLDGRNYKLYITPKSNILAGDYDQPAQKAPITLRDITDMLRDCFRCYWFVENGKFRIEHIDYFRKGGTYSGGEIVGVDLTALKVARNGKLWSMNTASYSYDKADMPERYQFGWMDDVTKPFNGEPINIKSAYVDAGNIEDINVANFTSDVDYMLLNPSACSSDGFALLGVVQSGNDLVVPIYQAQIGDITYNLQNMLMSFYYLQNYHLYDMPARRIEVNGEEREALGIKRQKTQQVKYPARVDTILQRLVKTEIGSGAIEKLSINLQSRQATATLKYDTE